ncbi:zinc finger protein 253-like isoform X2 [Onthophagus taurus]|uniref:zinc finger protein 253-like isoform X2 n=1 Tax=Onthophagus taurus TaxID=166361 RepID=UPI0039BDB13C
MMGTMSSIKEIMQFCRLCLVKDQVNVSIFEEHGDTRDVKRKISECLPVTVSEEDSLPKKICDGCLYKLELLYQFRTTCVSAEKQLQVWIAELNNSESKEDQDLKLQHSQTSVKEEIFDATDHPDNSEYVIEEQHISYEEGDIPYNESQDDNDDGDATNSSDDEPLAKRRKRFLEEQVQTDDTLKTADNKMAITKLEHESDDENVDDPEPNFVSVGTSDDQQPGPSGLNKMSATTTNAEMPCDLLSTNISIEDQAEYAKPNKRKMKKPIKVSEHNENMKIVYGDNETLDKKQLIKCDDLLFKCKLCKTEKIFSKKEVIQHYGLHHKDVRVPRSIRLARMFSCEICSKKFKLSHSLQVHMTTHNNTFLCVDCHLTFKKDIDYVLHCRKHCPDNKFKCVYCDYETSDVNDISQHLHSFHDKFRYTCKICNKGFDVLTWFEEHDNLHTGKKPFTCEFCGKSFIYSRYLAAHKTSMHKLEITGEASTYECPLCNKQYQHKNSLKVHMNSHTGNVAICDICGKQLSSTEKLKFHMRTHTGYKPFKCKFCEKCFTKKPILIEHERIHTGEKPYNCSYCHKSFSQRSSLVIHIRTHTGERPYVCHICNKGFVARSLLNIHFKNCKGY